MLLRLQNRPGTQGKLLGASVQRTEAERLVSFEADGDGKVVTIRDERGFVHELHLTPGECAMLARDLTATGGPGKLMPSQPMPVSDVTFFIAQGAINITEGHTTIERGSRVHRAMEDFCHYVGTGEIKVVR